jgi:hypothetical protein
MNRFGILSGVLGILFLSFTADAPANAQAANTNATGAAPVVAPPLSIPSTSSTGIGSTGANNLNAPTRSYLDNSGVAGYNEQVLIEGQEIYKRLRYYLSLRQAPRRFAREKDKEVCTDLCMEEATRARKFLESVNNPTPQLLQKKASGSRYLW